MSSKPQDAGIAPKSGVLFLHEHVGPRVFRLADRATILGREKADLHCNDPMVSAKHCQILFHDHAYYLLDMHSSNGTYLNGEKILKKILADKDCIRIGNLNLSFILEDANVAQIYPSIHLHRSFLHKTTTLDPSTQGWEHQTQLAALAPSIFWGFDIEFFYSNGNKTKFTIQSPHLKIGSQDPIFNLGAEGIAEAQVLLWVGTEGQVWAKDLNSNVESLLLEHPSSNETSFQTRKIKPAEQFNFSEHARLSIGNCSFTAKVHKTWLS